MVLFITGVRNINLQVYSILVNTIQTQKLGRCKYVCAYVLASVMPAFITLINYVITFLIFSSSAHTHLSAH